MTLARSKPVGILAAIALVVLSAVGLRLSDPDDNFQVINGVAGVGVKINNGEITVSRVTVGTFFIEYGKISDRTPGMFIAVTVSEAATGSKRLETSEARLLGKDVRYDSYQIMGILTVDPGFETSVDMSSRSTPLGLTALRWRSGRANSSRATSNAYESILASLPRTPNNGGLRLRTAALRCRAAPRRPSHESLAATAHPVCRRRIGRRPDLCDLVGDLRRNPLDPSLQHSSARGCRRGGGNLGTAAVAGPL
jgi:hypothetical protein